MSLSRAPESFVALVGMTHELQMTLSDQDQTRQRGTTGVSSREAAVRSRCWREERRTPERRRARRIDSLALLVGSSAVPGKRKVPKRRAEWGWGWGTWGRRRPERPSAREADCRRRRRVSSREGCIDRGDGQAQVPNGLAQPVRQRSEAQGMPCANGGQCDAASKLPGRNNENFRPRSCSAGADMGDPVRSAPSPVHRRVASATIGPGDSDDQSSALDKPAAPAAATRSCHRVLGVWHQVLDEPSCWALGVVRAAAALPRLVCHPVGLLPWPVVVAGWKPEPVTHPRATSRCLLETDVALRRAAAPAVGGESGANARQLRNGRTDNFQRLTTLREHRAQAETRLDKAVSPRQASEASRRTVWMAEALCGVLEEEEEHSERLFAKTCREQGICVGSEVRAAARSPRGRPLATGAALGNLNVSELLTVSCCATADELHRRNFHRNGVRKRSRYPRQLGISRSRSAAR